MHDTASSHLTASASTAPATTPDPAGVADRRSAAPTAVVIGASIGGLLAAAALAASYRRVLVVDRDRFGGYGEYRKGAQQAQHAHGLLAGGLRAMEELLPGLTDELVERGAIHGDVQERVVWVNEGRSLTNAPTGLMGLVTSRLLIEDQIRARVRALPGVEVHESCDVAGVQVDGGRVTGVRVTWRDQAIEESVAAELVVDASGRGSRAPSWLESLGYGAPRVDRITMGLTYTTREFVRSEPDDEATGVVIAATAEHPRIGVALAQPEGRWVVTLGGYLGEAAPTDVDGFRAFAGRLATDHLAQLLEGLEPVGDARTFKYHASAWRRYDRMRRLPEGLVVCGDAMCSFNPIFGQGMTVAAREALILRDLLRAHGTSRLPRRFHTAAAREIAIPWEIAAGSDLRFPAVTGKRSVKFALVNRYLGRYFRAAEHDDGLGLAFLRVVNLLARPESLMAPSRLVRVLRRGGARRDAQPHRDGRPVPVSATRGAEGRRRRRQPVGVSSSES